VSQIAGFGPRSPPSAQLHRIIIRYRAVRLSRSTTSASRSTVMDHREGEDPRSLADCIRGAVWRHLKAIIEAALSFPTGR
jgi:hypothetical protein